MSIALVVSSSQSLGVGGGTSTGINTTGADLIVVSIAQYAGTTTTPQALTDSKVGNTWHQLTYKKSAGGNSLSVIFYAINPAVGSGHTFTYTGSVVAAAISIMAFSGSDLTAPFDAENGAISNSTSSLATGSCAVNNANEVVVAAICLGNSFSAMGIGNSFTGLIQTAYSGGVNDGAAMAYKIASSAENPSFSWTTANEVALTIASFKAAAGGGGSTLSRYYYDQHVARAA